MYIEAGLKTQEAALSRVSEPTWKAVNCRVHDRLLALLEAL